MRVISGSTVTTWSKMSASEAHRGRLAATGEPLHLANTGSDTVRPGTRSSVARAAFRRPQHDAIHRRRQRATRRSRPTRFCISATSACETGGWRQTAASLDASDSAPTRVLAPCEQWPRSKR
jgi:hypothetical protein